jgi:hypothetical protein
MKNEIVRITRLLVIIMLVGTFGCDPSESDDYDPMIPVTPVSKGPTYCRKNADCENEKVCMVSDKGRICTDYLSASPPVWEGVKCYYEDILQCGMTIDPSDPESYGTYSGEAFLCVNGKFTSGFHCPTTQTCFTSYASVTANQIAGAVKCGADAEGAVEYALEGHACSKDQMAACSSDQTQVLNCQLGKWTVSRTCPTNVGKCDLLYAVDGVNCLGGHSSCIGCSSF